MMANYGSSEYAQAFSRVGSLFRNVYIVNEDLEVQDFGLSEGENSKTVNSVEINYNDNPIKISPHGGIVASVSYLPVIEKLL